MWSCCCCFTTPTPHPSEAPQRAFVPRKRAHHSAAGRAVPVRGVAGGCATAAGCSVVLKAAAWSWLLGAGGPYCGVLVPSPALPHSLYYS